MSAPPVYWDANVLLSYLNAVPERLPVIDELLRSSRAQEIEIITSSVSIAEVAFARGEKDAQQLDAQVEQDIDELWAPGSPVATVEFCEDRHRPRLRPASQAAVLRRTRSKPRRAEETSRVAYQHQRRAQRAGTPAALSEAPPIEGERVARARGRDTQPSPLERVPLCARRALCAGAGESAPATRKRNFAALPALLLRMAGQRR